MLVPETKMKTKLVLLTCLSISCLQEVKTFLYSTKKWKKRVDKTTLSPIMSLPIIIWLCHLKTWKLLFG